MNKSTSIKQLFQSMAPEMPCVVEGSVTCANPLKIVLTNDAKMILSGGSLVVPKHLTDHTVKADIAVRTGTLTGETNATLGEGAHSHNLSTFSITQGSIKIYNALKAGDKVYLLVLNGGKTYYILDRKES